MHARQFFGYTSTDRYTPTVKTILIIDKY